MAPFRPMLATVAERVPTGDAWVHEVKWDGMRVLVDVRDGKVTVWSRSERDVTAAFPELDALADAYDDMLLDGEVVALEAGRPSFHALTERMHVGKRRQAEALMATRPVTLMVFDLLRLFGQDLRSQPWSARRELLERLELTGRSWQVPAVHDDGAELLAATAAQGLEGIVSKRRSAPYATGRRSPDWRKTAHRATHSVVLGGWRPEAGSTSARLGAVLVGLPDGAGGWRYAGRVGSGLAGSAGEALRRRLQRMQRDDSPFSDEVPAVDASGTTWVEPRLVVEVRALELTGQHRLRQPTYLGVRSDLTPDDLVEAEDA
ncbi:non-homologous end-joining DNA ligase [Oryzobacter sp. R7]|uniref:non-homologous end-joining DNA ligase n=1 Tax=Oryzobacter faecalis TaxID=3388656 RepID=UPI00398CD336